MDDDRELYRRWLDRRDADAFATLVRRHADLVHDVAFRVAGDRAGAEDALQEALIRLAADGTSRPAEVGVRPWLAREAIGRARNARRSERARTQRERAVGEARKEALVDAQPDVDSEAVRDVETALRRADDEDAAILTLRFRHGVEYAELAAILDVSEGAARVRVHRATEALRRDDRLCRRDGPAIERALAGVPVVSAPVASLSSAIDAAIGAAGAPAVGAGAGVAVAATSGGGLLASLVALVPGGLFTLLAAGVVVAGGVLALVRGGGEARRAEPGLEAGAVARNDARADRGDVLPPTAAELAARPRGLGGAMEDRPGSAPDASQSPSAGPWQPKKELVPGLPAVPGKGPPKPVPAPRPASAGDSAGTASAQPPPNVHAPRLRAEVVPPDGPPIPVAIDQVMFHGSVIPVSVIESDGLRLATSPSSRSIVHVKTTDPRALVPWIRLFVTEPVPETLVARFPAASDPRLDPLVIEVLDATTGAPVSGAQLDWQWPGTRAATLTADAAGRIPVVATTGEDGVVERGIRALATRGFAIHAPGLRTSGEFGWEGAKDSRWQDPYGFALDQPLADAWRERGTWVVRLERQPEDLESKTARVLLDDGRPATGALVYVTSIAPSRIVKALGAALNPRDVDFTWRRVGVDGQIEFGARSRTALEVFIDDCPVGVFALSRDRWLASGPREIRLAPLADVTIAIQGIPDGKPPSWSFDPIGAARTPTDGSIVPITWDDGFDPKTREDEFSLFTFIGQRDLWGDLKPGRTEIRFRYPVGWDRPLYVRVGFDSRKFVVKAPSGAPFHLDVRWDEMEKMEKSISR